MKTVFLTKALLALTVAIEAASTPAPVVPPTPSAPVATDSSSCHGDYACSSAQGTIGYASCNGTHACRDSMGNVGDNSCYGQNACKTTSGSIGNDSCHDNYSCERLVDTTIADYSCQGRKACAEGVQSTIEWDSCTMPYSCFMMENADIGPQSCTASNACAVGRNIVVGAGSCQAWSACRDIADITIGSNSCNGKKACFEKPKFNIGSNSCNCEECCNCEDPTGLGENVSDNFCNEGDGCCGAPTRAPTRAPTPVPGKELFLSVIFPPTSAPFPSPAPSTSPLASPSGSISGNVQGDTNSDSSGDVNLAGVSIKLLDSVGGLVIATTETDASGNYVFYDVPAGAYSVMETNIASFSVDVSDTDAWNDNMIGVMVTPGFNSTGNDFVDAPMRTITGIVLEDEDNNDSGDRPVAGVRISVLNFAEVASTTTGQDGTFSVLVPPGYYTVIETTIPGFVGVSPSAISVNVLEGDKGGIVFVVEQSSAAPSAAVP